MFLNIKRHHTLWLIPIFPNQYFLFTVSIIFSNQYLFFTVEEINRYLLLVFQFVLSIVSAFAFGYLAPYYLYGTTSVGPRLLYGIISGFVVGIADLYFVLRHLLEIEGVIDKKIN